MDTDMDVDAYVGGYRGRIRITRLIATADAANDKTLQETCLLKALSLIENETLDADLYRKVAHKLGSRSPAGAESVAERMQAEAEALTEKLDGEVKAYKNNLIKESIRLGQQDLANHYVRCGQLDAAAKLLARNRDYCTTDTQVYATTLDMCKLAIQLHNWIQVGNSISKLESIGQLDVDGLDPALADADVRRDQIAIAHALADLGVSAYETAAGRLSKLTAKLGDTFNDVLTMRDVADLNCVLTLATSTRPQLLGLLESNTYKPYLELDIDAREAMWSFHRGQYSDCFRLLGPVWRRLRCDPFCGAHVARLQVLLKGRALARYCGAFKRIPLDRMALALDYTDTATLLETVEQTIADGRLPGWRIDSRANALVYAVAPETSGNVDLKAASFKDEVERTLMRLQIRRAGLEPERSRTNQTDDAADNDDGGGGGGERRPEQSMQEHMNAIRRARPQFS